MRNHLGPIFIALAACTTSACGEPATQPAEAPEPAPAQTPAPAPAPATTQKKGDDPAQSDINISDEIKRACGLSELEAHFDYNSANIKSSDRAVMKKLADCFTVGKLKGRVMRLVGHADPRGESEYNMVLGGRRAGNVGTAVKNAGLPKAQVETTSRGEMDARGSDEETWALDRRVDIHLKEAE